MQLDLRVRWFCPPSPPYPLFLCKESSSKRTRGPCVPYLPKRIPRLAGPEGIFEVVSGCRSQILVNVPVVLQNHMRYITNLQVPGSRPRHVDGVGLGKAWGSLCASVGPPPSSGVQLHYPFGLAVPSALQSQLLLGKK